MNIAAYNGLLYHYEMFGYIIYFCYMNKHILTIYCDVTKDMGYISFYNRLFKDYNVIYKPIAVFDTDKHTFDAIILLTAEDNTFNRDNITLNKIICVDHLTNICSPWFTNRIATRPFADIDIHQRTWALPTYPIINSKQQSRSSSTLNIVILGHTPTKYNTQIINRLCDSNRITIHAISRSDPLKRSIRFLKIRSHSAPNKFEGLADSFTLIRHYDLQTNALMDILCNADYILTDLTDHKDYTTGCMAGVIPLSFCVLVPLIISKQTNAYYKFTNVVEFDKDSADPILLKPIDHSLLEKERDQHIQNNNAMFTRLVSEISQGKDCLKCAYSED